MDDEYDADIEKVAITVFESERVRVLSSREEQEVVNEGQGDLYDQSTFPVSESKEWTLAEREISEAAKINEGGELIRTEDVPVDRNPKVGTRHFSVGVQLESQRPPTRIARNKTKIIPPPIDCVFTIVYSPAGNGPSSMGVRPTSTCLPASS